MELPLGWQTDLAVHRLRGAEVVLHEDHVVVRTPTNPLYHWGNTLIVTDPGAVDDVPRWSDLFRAEFPGSPHRTVGLVARPSDPGAWAAAGTPLIDDPVMVAAAALVARPLPHGYEARVLVTDEDWSRSTGLREASFGVSEYERLTTLSNAAMAARGDITWFGAFAGPELVSELGIVNCGGGTWRYQSVVTHPEHRRRGLTGHLLGRADARARAAGADRCVIVADEGDASRLYAALGFVERERHVGAYFAPPES